MREIAVYGKGGIGKSTLSANLSAALQLSGRKVLQIGCDPKHDSTRLLLSGKMLTTVLDYIRETGPADYQITEVLQKGYAGIGCVEAGGPKPGVGCAGRGIITAFDMLVQFQVRQNYDTVLYDVLGDVVCGGFAVPIRAEYADTIFLVTSGEYMAIYAANNILRGIENYDKRNRKRVAGILYNARNLEGEDARVEAFAKAVGLPICARIPRDDIFAEAERANCTVVELAQRDNEDAKIMAERFVVLAENINKELPLHYACPLTDEELEEAVLSVKIIKAPVTKSVDEMDEENEVVEILPDLTNPNRYLSKNLVRNEPLHGCAFNGAATMSVHLQDAIILVHSPKSCAWISWQTISSSGRRQLFERGALLPTSLSPNFVSTEMSETDMVFGGMEKLRDTVERLKRSRPKAIVIISSCPSGIIGDDIEQMKALSEPDLPVITIKADGNLTGDYLQGMILAYTQLAKQMIRRNEPIKPNTVNIVFEKVVSKNTNSNYKIIEDFLHQMEITVNCRFLCETTCEKLASFASAPLNLLAYRDYTGMLLEDFFKREYHLNFLERGFPVGFEDTREWLLEIGEFFGKTTIANRIIEVQKEIYFSRMEKVRPILQGKKLMIVTYNHEIDWIIEAAMDAGMEIVKIGILNFSQDEGFRTRLNLETEVEENYNRDRLNQDVAMYQPDIFLSNYSSSMENKELLQDTIPMCPDVGFFSGLLMMERWTKLLDMNLQGEWKDDEVLFKSYYCR